MNPSDRQAIINAVHSYRPGAPIVIEDIRVACAADGHSIKHISSNEIPTVLRKICDSVPVHPEYHERCSWVWRE